MRLSRPFVLLSLVAFSISFVASPPSVGGQSAASQALAGQPSVPQWQTDARGKMAFDVASVKQNKSGQPPSGPRPTSNFPLDDGPTYSTNGGLFSATNWPLRVYIAFAYKLDSVQLRNVPGLPAWADTDCFDIEARAQGNPAKDQMRLMMQSLLADRFKLALHTEAKPITFDALVLIKEGKTGPQLLAHDDARCANKPGSSPTSPGSQSPGMPPFICGQLQLFTDFKGPGVRGVPCPPAYGGLFATAGNITMESFAAKLSGLVGRRVVDHTGLSGTFDLYLGFMPLPGQSGPPPSPNAGPDPAAAPDIFTALREQLGLKVESQTGAVGSLVIDHIEEPSPN
jgi:uncharacterized protein (TIGR03435 family)